MFGRETMEAFSRARVFVAGAGAVGGFAIEALARSGVGGFVVADFDVAERSNVNRQLLALESTLGKKKCVLAKDRILSINPQANVECADAFIDAKNVGEILNGGKFDIVVDAIDSLGAKADLLAYCVGAGIPAVSSMGAARKTNPFAVSACDITKTRVCPLASKLRSELKKRGALKSGCIDCVYSEELCDKSSHMLLKDSEDGAVQRIMGSCVSVTGVFGLMLAHIALARLAGKSYDFKPGAK